MGEPFTLDRLEEAIPLAKKAPRTNCVDTRRGERRLLPHNQAWAHNMRTVVDRRK